MNIKPVIFSSDEIAAINAGRKTMFRMPVKTTAEHLYKAVGGLCGFFMDRPVGDRANLIKAPYQIGDILWVRETWQHAYDLDENDQEIEGTGRYLYAATDTSPFGSWVRDDGSHTETMPWCPSVHMPREAARLFLRVTGVKVERLQDINHDDCLCEGLAECGGHSKEEDCDCIIMSYAKIWNALNAKRGHGWDKNPWVFAHTIERTEKPAGWPCADSEATT